jgi:hypothetical protein
MDPDHFAAKADPMPSGSEHQLHPTVVDHKLVRDLPPLTPTQIRLRSCRGSTPRRRKHFAPHHRSALFLERFATSVEPSQFKLVWLGHPNPGDYKSPLIDW